MISRIGRTTMGRSALLLWGMILSAYYEAGNKLTATLQFLMHIGFDEARLVGRYRRRADGHLPAAGGPLIPAESQVVPDQFVTMGSYRARISEVVSLTPMVRGRFFSETNRSARQLVYELGIKPEFAFSNGLRLRPRFVYTLGGFSGFNAGFDLGMRL